MKRILTFTQVQRMEEAQIKQHMPHLAAAETEADRMAWEARKIEIALAKAPQSTFERIWGATNNVCQTYHF